MRIVIIGGGEVGLALSRELSRSHEIFVVDHDPAVADRFARMDVQFLTGSGTSPDVLRQAGIDQADLLIACTGLDEVNVLACLMGKRLGQPATICLVAREDLLQALGASGLLGEHFRIDRVLWPEAQLADEIDRVIAAPGSIDAEAFAEGRVSLLEYRLLQGSPISGRSLAELRLPRGCLVVGVRSGDHFTIPRGTTRLEPGDKVFFMGNTEAMRAVQRLATGAREGRRQTVTIIGGGDVGLRLAQALDARPEIGLRVIERDARRGELLAATLKRALVLQGDGTDLELLEAEEIGRSDVLVTVIDNDERNLFASLLGRQLGVKRVITRVSHMANLRLFERMGVDVALSARGAAVASIVHQVEGGKSKLLAVLEEGQAQVVEIEVPPGYPPTALRDLRPLPQTIIGAIVRESGVIVPGGEDRIAPGDRLLVFSAAKQVDRVRDYFAARAS
jgi:trk system potassium uptake protein